MSEPEEMIELPGGDMVSSTTLSPPNTRLLLGVFAVDANMDRTIWEWAVVQSSAVLSAL